MYFKDAIIRWYDYQLTCWKSLVYRATAQRFIEQWIQIWGGRDVGAITVLDVENRYIKRVKTKSNDILNTERGFLTAFFRWARAHGLTVLDPMQTWPYRTVQTRKKPASLSELHELALFQQMPEWLRRYSEFSLYTGLRQGTIRRLWWHDIRDGYVYVPGDKMKMGEALVIPLVQKAAAALGPRALVDGPLFPQMKTAPEIWRAFQKAVKTAGIGLHLSPHDLRKTCATRLIEKGVPLLVVMQLLGWKRPSTLLVHYLAKPALTHLRETMEKLIQ